MKQKEYAGDLVDEQVAEQSPHPSPLPLAQERDPEPRACRKSDGGWHRQPSAVARAWNLTAAIATGAMMVIAAPGVLPWRWAGLVAWVAFVPLLWILARLDGPRALMHGWIAGLVFQVGAASWYPGLFARYSGMHPFLAMASSVLVWSLQAMTWGVWAAVVAWMNRRLRDRSAHSALLSAVLAAGAFAVIECFAPTVFHGPIALTQARFPWIAQIAEPFGVHAVSFLIIVSACAIARRRLLLLAPPIAALGFGAWRVGVVREDRNAAPALRVGMVQEATIASGWATPPEDKEAASRYRRATARLEKELPVDMVVWPEKAWPELIRGDAKHDYPEQSPKRIRQGFSSRVLFGLTSVDVATRRASNSAAMLEPDGKLSVFYDKVELIPYSESAYRAGTRLEPYQVNGVPLGMMICFESTFAGHSRKLVERGAGVLVNLTDDTWFGASAEPEQHFAHAIFRAIETRRDLVRASAAGPSACIAATGEVVASTGLGQGTLVCEARVLTRKGVGGMPGILGLIAGLGAVLVIQCRRCWKQEVRSRRSR